MNFRPSLLAGAVGAAILLSAGAGAADAAELRFAERPIEGEYIVVLKDEAASLASEQSASSAPRVAAVAQNVAAAYGAQVVDTFEHALRGFVVRASDAKLARMLMDERIAYIEENGRMHALGTQQNPTWGLDRVDQRDLPLSDSYTYDTTAAGVHAYIVDTGVRSSHSDFGGRVGNGYSAINDGRGTNDCNGHGTHVAGTVGGATWGVAKGVTLHPVRVLGCDGSGSNAGVIAGIDWVTANHVKPAVANMSLGGGASSALDDAVENSIAAGVTYAVAAGNSNDNACNYSPARVGPALTVGSSTSSDSRSSFSSYGTCLDIFAPGSSITSAWHTSNSATNTISGTSMASPHVAGAAALYLATHPSATPGQVDAALTGAASENRLSDVRSGSPNLLLYTQASGDEDPPPDGDELENGVPVTGLSGASGSEKVFTLEVPAGADSVVFEMGGGSGDADMYVRFGSPPTTSTYDCRPYRSGNSETCTSANPQAGTWYVMIRGYSAYSGLTLTGTHGGDGSPPDGDDPCTDCTAYSGSLSGSGDSDVQPNGTYYQASSGTHEGWLKGPAGTDFDLELHRWNGSSWTRVSQSAGSSSEEHVSYYGASGFYYWRIVSYSGSGDYDFWLSQP